MEYHPSVSSTMKRSGLNFINVLHTDLMHVDPECAKKTVKSAVSFGAFGTHERKSCTLNVGEIDTCRPFFRRNLPDISDDENQAF